MSNAGTIKDNKHYMNEMIACYREEAIECVKDHVLQIHKQIYAKYKGTGAGKAEQQRMGSN